MSRALRLSEKWFQRGLWLVALAFASFLIGLGGKVVGSLQGVERPLALEQFMDPARTPQLREALKREERHMSQANTALEQARQQHQVAVANTRAARETFDNWLATRHVTARPEQDTELIARTRELDTLKAAERKQLSAVEAQQQAYLDARQAKDAAQAQWDELERAAQGAYDSAWRARELRVFLYRLLLTLPLLVVAGWLFKTRRKSTYWPFVWGFIYFAGFAFFVELVPYLPSYGGYVRYIVGIVLTVLIGRQAIVSLQRYLEKQKAAEALPDSQRRGTLKYDVALARLAKGVCPGCERAVDLKQPEVDYCQHCGICLYDRCVQCASRKNAFSRFCYACGTPAQAPPAD
ncbi:MAG: serine endopeptidase [Pseudomonadota bacterium]